MRGQVIVLVNLIRNWATIFKLESFYKLAYELADAHPDFANKYATALAQNENLKDALLVLQKTITEYPKYPAALSNLGYLGVGK